MSALPRGAHVSSPLDRSLVEQHLEALLPTARALPGSRHDAEALVQETLARERARPRIVRRQDDPRYLIRALRNTWIDMQRARTARPPTTGAEAACVSCEREVMKVRKAASSSTAALATKVLW